MAPVSAYPSSYFTTRNLLSRRSSEATNKTKKHNGFAHLFAQSHRSGKMNGVGASQSMILGQNPRGPNHALGDINNEIIFPILVADS